jgi:hypothetical protein
MFKAAAFVLASTAAPVMLSACGSSSTSAAIPGLRMWASVELTHISCPEVHACVAVGSRLHDGDTVPVVVEQSGSSWTTPIALGTPLSGTDVSADTDIACSGPGNCIVDGATGDGSAAMQLFEESNGHWDSAHVVTIPDSLGLFGHMPACSPGGSCWAIIGQNTSGSNPTIWTYAVGVDHGQWDKPYKVGGRRFLIDGQPDFTLIDYVISCGSPSYCTTVGMTASHRSNGLVFLQTQSDGSWNEPELLPTSTWSRPASSFSVGIPGPQPIACTSKGTCLIAGHEGTLGQAAVVQVVDGHWQRPVGDIGVTAPYTESSVDAVACNSFALCVAGGSTGLASGTHEEPFAQLRVRGHWLKPALLTGVSVGANGGVRITGAACPTPSSCDLVGQQNVGRSEYSFVASYRGSTWSSSLVKIDGVRDGVLLSPPSCTDGACWVAGVVESSPGTPKEGLVLPLGSVDSGHA